MGDRMTEESKLEVPRKWIWAAFLGPLILLPILSLFGLFDFELGGKAMVDGAISNTLVRSLLFLTILHTVFVGPYVLFIRPQFQNRTEVERVLMACVFLGLPLSGFAYYEGSVKTLLDYHEWILAFLPALIISTVLYERTEKLWAYSLCLGLQFIYSVYLLNDVLTPYSTLLNTVAKSEWLYFFRTVLLTAVTAVIAAVIPPKTLKDSRQELRANVAVLGALWIVLDFVLPSLIRSTALETKIPLLHQWEWILVPVLLGFLFAKKEISNLAALVLSAALIVASAYSLIDLVRNFERDFWKLTWAMFHISVLVTSAKIFVLMRASVVKKNTLFKIPARVV